MMSTTVWSLELSLGVSCLLVHARLPHCCVVDESVAGTGAAVNTMLASQSQLCSRSSVILVTDHSYWATAVLTEADFALGPFAMTHDRNKWIDYTFSIYCVECTVFAARGRPKVDPWGFLQPLLPLVWAAVVIALLAVISVMLLVPSCLPTHTHHRARRDINIVNCVRILLQEDVTKTVRWWWWERMVLGVWMMMMMVLTQSYTSNLMSLLAVRHIDQPYETLRDVLDDTDVGIILVADSANIPYFRAVESGIFRELGDLLDTERVTFNTNSELSGSMDKLVRAGTHVIFDIDSNFWNMRAEDFSVTGKCDFYLGRDTYLPYPLAMIAQKNSPLTPAVDEGCRALVEFGLYDRWARFSLANTSSCLSTPRTITVTTVLSVNNFWGMFVVFGLGCVIGVLVFVMENTVTYVLSK